MKYVQYIVHDDDEVNEAIGFNLKSYFRLIVVVLNERC